MMTEYTIFDMFVFCYSCYCFKIHELYEYVLPIVLVS